VAWVLGHRDTATFRRLYRKVSHLKNCVFYTDDWDAFSNITVVNVFCSSDATSQ
jgi:insertion element IS1 protein InsB